MATFAHDPTRVHPPAKDWGWPSVAAEEGKNVANPPSGPSVADTPTVVQGDVVTPLTSSIYNTGESLVAVALGGSGEPHRIVYVSTIRDARGQGKARANMTQVLADMDADGRDSVVFINNVDPDCDVGRLTGFFESLGYVQQTINPDYPLPQLIRVAQANGTNR